MKIVKSITVALLLLNFVACNDSGVDKSTIQPKSPAPVCPKPPEPPAAKKCSETLNFNGIRSIENITDVSVDLVWTPNEDAIGYVIYQKHNNSLSLLGTINASAGSYRVSNLTPNTAYQFLVRSMDQESFIDCNEAYQTVTTGSQQTFSSCHEIYNFHTTPPASGFYSIDLDKSGPLAAMDVYCDMDNNDGGWTRVFNHNVISGLFSSNQDAQEKNLQAPGEDLYSILSKLESFRREGELTFWLYYPELDNTNGGNIWTQTSNPTTEDVVGFTPVRTDHSENGWVGLGLNAGEETFIDGTSAKKKWNYAIGAKSYGANAGEIPGPRDGVTQVQLFVR